MRALALLTALATPALAQPDALTLPPGAEPTMAATESFGAHAVATGPFDGAAVPLEEAEGTVARQVWRIPAADRSTLAILAPLRAQLRRSGWEVLLDCAARACGGFDFRFALDVVPAPEMFVDLGDYRYLSARRGDARTDLIVSRSGDVGYVQATAVVPPNEAPPPSPVSAEADASVEAVKSASEVAPTDLARALDAAGRAVLDDVAFPSGGSALEDGDAPSLAALAAYLDARPAVTVALVGHTDAQGGTAPNLALSQRRAEAVRAALIERHGADPARVEARGVAYFAPRSANTTPEGRAANRRVEAVVTSAP